MQRSKNRFIPTCMGNSPVPEEGLVYEAVHPHVHGELVDMLIDCSSDIGSSPRAWGTHLFGGEHLPGRRFIPTCMGNSMRPNWSNILSTVHPHVHGELDIVTVGSDWKIGSSPRAWGTPG